VREKSGRKKQAPAPANSRPRLRTALQALGQRHGDNQSEQHRSPRFFAKNPSSLEMLFVLVAFLALVAASNQCPKVSGGLCWEKKKLPRSFQRVGTASREARSMWGR
jgi:hypothetical protein